MTTFTHKGREVSLCNYGQLGGIVAEWAIESMNTHWAWSYRHDGKYHSNDGYSSESEARNAAISQIDRP